MDQMGEAQTKAEFFFRECRLHSKEWVAAAVDYFSDKHVRGAFVVLFNIEDSLAKLKTYTQVPLHFKGRDSLIKCSYAPVLRCIDSYNPHAEVVVLLGLRRKGVLRYWCTQKFSRDASLFVNKTTYRDIL